MVETAHVSVRGSRLGLLMMAVWLGFLLLTGGASRSDVLAQPFVRGVAWFMLFLIVFMDDLSWKDRLRIPALLLAAAAILVLCQLLPLPPAIWLNLPGHERFAEAANILGGPQPWRPLSISPAATLNSLGSLIIPVVTFLLMSRLREEDWRKVLVFLAVIIIYSCTLAAFQISGRAFDHPLYNDLSGDIGGAFANRNHQSLVTAIGILILPSWLAYTRWRPAVVAAYMLVVVATLMVILLAIGSRSGLVLGSLASIASALINRRVLARALQGLGRREVVLVSLATGAIVLLPIIGSIITGRSVAIERMLSLSSGNDLRTQSTGVVLEMVADYFPFGSGFGTFDTAYRIVEPDRLLELKYLNQAHNDLLQVWLEGGLAAGILLACGVLWWVSASIKAWRMPGARFARLGSAICGMILLASLTDYPARTPLVMTFLIIGAVWLSSAMSRPWSRAD